jgi:hypothetical protein
MAMPQFGFFKIEAFACILMVVAGIAGLLLIATNSSDWVLAGFLKQWPAAHVGPGWLALQSIAIVLGGIGAWWSRSFTVAAIGVVAALVAGTAVGHISFFPGLLMLVLICSRYRAFDVFLPIWRGPGPPPPGWRGDGKTPARGEMSEMEMTVVGRKP